MQTSFVAISANTKTGAIPVTYTERGSCSTTCILQKNGCYADGGHVSIHWNKVSSKERGDAFPEAMAKVNGLPIGTVWRHNIAGDLVTTEPGNGEICELSAKKLTRANRRKKGFGYTHHPLTDSNIIILKRMNKDGFAINHSADSPQEAVRAYKRHSIPAVTILPTNAPNVQHIHGVPVVACPAEKSDLQCARCAPNMCGNPDRKFIIGFRAHGNRTAKVSLIATNSLHYRANLIASSK